VYLINNYRLKANSRCVHSIIILHLAFTLLKDKFLSEIQKVRLIVALYTKIKIKSIKTCTPIKYRCFMVDCAAECASTRLISELN